MDAKIVLEISIAVLGIILALIAVIYKSQTDELKRLAKNIHELRNTVQELAVKLATLVKRR